MGVREALQHWPQFPPFAHLCSITLDVEYPTGAAENSLHPRLGNHASTAYRLYTADSPGHTWYYFKAKA